MNFQSQENKGLHVFLGQSKLICMKDLHHVHSKKMLCIAQLGKYLSPFTAITPLPLSMLSIPLKKERGPDFSGLKNRYNYWYIVLLKYNQKY